MQLAAKAWATEKALPFKLAFCWLQMTFQSQPWIAMNEADFDVGRIPALRKAKPDNLNSRLSQLDLEGDEHSLRQLTKAH